MMKRAPRRMLRRYHLRSRPVRRCHSRSYGARKLRSYVRKWRH